MRLTGPRAYSGPPPLPKMPPGLVELMEELTRDVLKHNPPNVYEFCANHMSNLLELRDGRAPKQHLTLERKIARAQEKVRQRAEERRRKYDEEMKLLSIKDTVESSSQENNISNVSEKESVLKAPVHHEHDLVDALEVEIFHNVENDLPDGRSSEVKDETAEEILKDAIERKPEDLEVQPANFKTEGLLRTDEGVLEKDKSFIIEDVIEHDNEDEYPIHVRQRRSIDFDGEEINDNNATENIIDDTAKLEESGEKEEETIKVVDGNLSTTNETNTLLESEGFAEENQVNIVKLDETINNSPLDAAEVNNESIPKILVNIGNDLVATTDTTDVTAEAKEDNKVDENMTTTKYIIKDAPVTAADENEESCTVVKDKYLESIAVAENRVEEGLKMADDNIIEIKIVENDNIPESALAAEDVIEYNTVKSFVEEASDISALLSNNVLEKPMVTDDIIDERKVSAEENIDTSAVFARELTDDTAGFDKEDFDKSTLAVSKVFGENTPIVEEKNTKNIVACKEKVGGEGNTDDASIASIKDDNESVKNFEENIVDNTNITVENPSIVEIKLADAEDTKEEIKLGQDLDSILKSTENSADYVVACTSEENDQSNENFIHKTDEDVVKDTATDFPVTGVQTKDIITENVLEPLSTEESFGQNVIVNAGEDDKSKQLSIDFAPETKLEIVQQHTSGTGAKRTETTSELDVIKDNNLNETINQYENALNVASEPTSENDVIDFKVVEKPCTDNFTQNELPNGHNLDEKSDSENSVENYAVNSTSKELHTDTISTIKSSSVDSAANSSNESLIDTETIKNAESLERDIIPSSMDLETAAVTIQKVFRTFLFKSRGSTFDDNSNDENQTDEDKEQLIEYTVPSPILNKERRALGINRMESVLQTVNEEKSLSLSMDDSSSLSSAATIIQSHVRGFLVRNRLNSNKTASTSLVNSDGPSMSQETNDDPQQKTNKTILNIHIVPQGEHFLSRDESVLTSMELSLDGSPPSSINLHPLGYDKSERRKQLKREDAIQSISPPSNNSGKLSEDVDSVKEVLVTEAPSEQPSISLIEEDANTTSRDASPIKSTTIETVVEDHKNMKYAAKDSEPQKESHILAKRSTLTKMSSDESDVVTPFEEKNSIDSDNTSRLLHSGEFHDVVLPTKVSRNDTSVGREFKNVLVYFLMWNNS